MVLIFIVFELKVRLKIWSKLKVKSRKANLICKDIKSNFGHGKLTESSCFYDGFNFLVL